MDNCAHFHLQKQPNNTWHTFKRLLETFAHDFFFCSRPTTKLINLMHIHQTHNLLLHVGLRCGDCQVIVRTRKFAVKLVKKSPCINSLSLSSSVSSSACHHALVNFLTCLNCVCLSPLAPVYWSCTTCQFFPGTHQDFQLQRSSVILHVLSWFFKKFFTFARYLLAKPAQITSLLHLGHSSQCPQ